MQVLGLDLGTNSVGWALLNSNLLIPKNKSQLQLARLLAHVMMARRIQPSAPWHPELPSTDRLLGAQAGLNWDAAQ